MIYRTIWVITYTLKYLKIVWSELLISTHCSRLVISLRSKWEVAQMLAYLITVVYFKDRNWICKTVSCISFLVACKIGFCSEFPDIPDSPGRKTTRRRTQAIAKRYAFHANATRSWWRLKRLRIESRICRTEKLLHHRCFLIMLLCSKNFREFRWALTSSRSQTYTKKATKEEFLENSYTFYVTQIILPNIVLLRSYLTRNAQVVQQREIEKVRKAKQIKSTQLYDKCWRCIIAMIFIE